MEGMDLNQKYDTLSRLVDSSPAAKEFAEVGIKLNPPKTLFSPLVYSFFDMPLLPTLQCLLIPSRLIPVYYFRVALSFNKIYRPKIALFCLTVDFLSLLFLDLYGRS